jgi:flagellar motor switch protein FliN/FliY
MSKSPSKRDARRAAYRRRLLLVPVTATVTLARARLPLGTILSLAPGSVLHFDISSCEALELRLGRQTLARGQCVEMKDQLGLVVTSLAK